MAGAVGAAAALMLAGIVPAAAADDDTIDMPDDALRACVNEAIDDNRDPEGVITEAEASALSGSLECNQEGISNIAGLQHFTSLTRLNLSGNQIEDLTPLADLTEITRLYVSRNDLTDLSALDRKSVV